MHVCESMAIHCSGSGQVPRRKHQYKDASEHITQQGVSTITQQEDERTGLYRVSTSQKGEGGIIQPPAAESSGGKHGDLSPV